MRTLIIRAMCGLIMVYRYSFAFFLGRHCRYLPTCSNYGLEALQIHGPFNGSWLILRRLARCHPWGDQGYDPVPASDNSANKALTHLKNE